MPREPSPSLPRDPGADAPPNGDRRRRRRVDGRNFVFWTLVALVITAPTVTLPLEGGWISAKTFALGATGALLATLVLATEGFPRERIRAALRSPVILFVLAFLGWVGISAARSELPELSRYEAARHLGGALVFFAVCYGFSVRRHLSRFMLALSAAGSLAAILALIGFAGGEGGDVAGAFHNRQLLAGFLAVIMPLVLITSQADEEHPPRQIAAQMALVAVVAGLLLTLNRSAWAGALVALTVLTLLHLGRARRSTGFALQRQHIVLPVLLIAIGAGTFLALSGTGGVLSERASTLAAIHEDKSWRWRVGMWDKARRMVRDRPAQGWGVGLFPVRQALYMHEAVPYRPPERILSDGVTLSENAHNTYVQIAVELGIPGLLLYLGIFVAFIATALRTLSRVRHRFRQSILMATIAAVAGQMVSAIGSPAWEFPECSMFLWIVLGLGMALVISAEEEPARRSSPAPGG